MLAFINPVYLFFTDKTNKVGILMIVLMFEGCVVEAGVKLMSVNCVF